MATAVNCRVVFAWRIYSTVALKCGSNGRVSDLAGFVASNNDWLLSVLHSFAVWVQDSDNPRSGHASLKYNGYEL